MNRNMSNDYESYNIFKFTKRSYNEALSLLVFSRDYFSSNGRVDKMNLSSEDSIMYTIAMSKITTQLTSSLSWLLMCRAIESGEISIKELSKDEFSMPGQDSQIEIDNSRFFNLNETMQELLTKSSNMYDRIKRLETSVHKMMEDQTELAH